MTIASLLFYFILKVIFMYGKVNRRAFLMFNVLNNDIMKVFMNYIWKNGYNSCIKNAFSSDCKKKVFIYTMKKEKKQQRNHVNNCYQVFTCLMRGHGCRMICSLQRFTMHLSTPVSPPIHIWRYLWRCIRGGTKYEAVSPCTERSGKKTP